MTGIIIGMGEVGQALYKTLNRVHKSTWRRDKNWCEYYGRVEIMHICFPWNKNFVKEVKKYAKEYEPKYIVVHSTIPIGTTRKISKNAWHSPIRGVHPLLEISNRTFVKFIGGRKDIKLQKYFEAAGIKTRFCEKPETTEAMKLWSTLQYAISIVVEKEIWDYCRKHGLNFDDVYTEANKTYNEGYRKLGKPEVIRPVLKHIPGKIGGHCLIPNAKLIKHWLGDLVIKVNKKYGKTSV